jgi:hypothetical protein
MGIEALKEMKESLVKCTRPQIENLMDPNVNSKELG